MSVFEPVFAIVTPSYNQAAFLPKTLESVLTQEGDFRIDYLVKDGGSSDGSVEILARFKSMVDSGELPCRCQGVSFRYDSGRDGGQYEAINAGFAETSGGVMAWLNSDDMYLPGALATVATVFGRFPQVEWLTSNQIKLNGRGMLVELDMVGPFPRRMVQRGLYNGRDNRFIQQESTFWRRSLWDKAGGLDTRYRYAADFDLWTRFARETDLVLVDTLLAAFRRHGNQKTATFERYEREMDAMVTGSHLDKARMLASRAMSRVRGLDRISLCGLTAPAVTYCRETDTWRMRTLRGTRR
ncbi:glycosyltransferase family 2 protein [Desulfocurvibacter africanus]|uniref:glycosyltransferase family 2 protein n=1 Tax=Desulfocurvibacter africanus TaxID=873 RepID=UPI000408B2E7|nr:glycosyltransferase family 2 protein [Desulfocurvibacter africanus]